MWLISLFIIENNFNISKFYETSNNDLRAFFFSSSLRAFFLGDLLTKLPLCLVHVPMSFSLSGFPMGTQSNSSSIFSELLLEIQRLMIEHCVYFTTQIIFINKMFNISTQSCSIAVFCVLVDQKTLSCSNYILF